MRRVKRAWALLVVLLVCAALTACSEPSASDQIKQDIEAYKGNSEAILEDVCDRIGKIDDETKDLEEVQAFLAKAVDFEYEIVEENISEDGETGSVSVKVTTYPFGSAFTKTIKDTYIGVAKGEINQDAQTKELEKAIFGGLAAPEEKSYEGTVTIACSKEDGKWVTDVSTNDEFKDAALGGLLTSVDDFLANGTKMADTLEEFLEVVPGYKEALISSLKSGFAESLGEGGEEALNVEFVGNKVIITIDTTSLIGEGITLSDSDLSNIKDLIDNEFESSSDTSIETFIDSMESYTYIDGITVDMVYTYGDMEIYRRTFSN